MISPLALRSGEVKSASSSRFQGMRMRLIPYCFVAPFVVLFVGFLVVPIFVALVTSGYAVSESGLGFSGSSGSVFVGLKNYAAALADPNFIAGFGRVALFGIVQVPVMLGLALVLALLFDSSATKLKRFFQLGFFLPYAVPGVVAALLWGFLYQPAVSPVVQGLRNAGIPVDFLAPGSVLWSIANITTWSYAGVNMVVMFSALQAVPRELYEAARIDGASELRTALQIKVPMIGSAILLTCLFSVIGTFQLFNEPQVMRALTSNIGSEYTPNMAIYSTATQGANLNLASAMAMILAVVIFVLSVGASKVANRKGKVKL